ncbi:MAG: ion transporter [Phycisphaeraceae bacterium]
MSSDTPGDKARDAKPAVEGEARRQRWKLFYRLEATAERPMVVLALVWLILMIVEFTQGLGTTLLYISYGIWVIFILDFLLRFSLAPRKLGFFKRNWLTAVSLILPALRVLRIFAGLRFLRAARLMRSVSLARVITSLNRSLWALNKALRRRGLGYVIAATVLVIFGGAAGMAIFETPSALRAAGHLSEAEAGGLASYADAVWWTAMIMTTLGSEYWPKTPEGRVLAWLLAVYALAVFGYITASIASSFLEPDPNRSPATSAEVRALHQRIVTLQKQLAERDADGR